MNPTTPYRSHKCVIFHFRVHQPRRLNKFQFFDIGSHRSYFDDRLNEHNSARYLPANRMLLDVVRQHPSVKLCFSISGVALDQFEKYAPEVLDSFKELADTGAVEFLAETNYRSIASLISYDEFQSQILEHVEKVHHHFGLQPSVFSHTELKYNDTIGSIVSQMGFKGILCDGMQLTSTSSEDVFYKHPDKNNLNILLRSNRLSNDVMLRHRDGKNTLTVDEFTKTLYAVPGENAAILLGIDYQTLGEHQRESNGILDFLNELIVRVDGDKVMRILSPSEFFEHNVQSSLIALPHTNSLSGEAVVGSGLLDNEMQTEAFEAVKALGTRVKETGSNELMDIWRHFQAIDHFHFMSTKVLSDRSHSYFSQFASPYGAFINYMNILSDFEQLLRETPAQTDPTEQARKLEYERQHSSPPEWAAHHQSHYMKMP